MASPTKEKAADKPLTPAMEDYLEAIFEIDQEKKVIRVKDIAKRMDVKMPTVSSMLKTLNSRGMVHYEKYEYVELTKNGAGVGKEMRRRHEALFKFLTEILKIDSETADEEACKMEHALGSTTLDSLTDFMEFIRTCPRAGESWLRHFEDFRAHGQSPEKCRSRKDCLTSEFQTRIDCMEDPSVPE